ncbi:hypothetical protein HK107_02365 [Parvularcula sp. ZS-1/3]|uniref:VPLPA-CTERM sorting domain-containing protein n=1 Tax=Parvularcula mediterranea TaxID=2732508 RepID=A0A7Y3RJF2_9PROT|nr:hypothetical protein [Parvularcula mediterranea]NNU15168.1 hypothetical protein [Parvularcula mediterranea]
MKTTLLACAALAFAGSAHAASISEVNLGALGFDVQTETPITSPDQIASYTGTSTSESGTVGWSLASAFNPLTDTSSTRILNAVPFGAFDVEHVHVGGFDITFDAPITSILFLAQNDNTGRTTAIDLGKIADDVAGTAPLNGTAYTINNQALGAFVLYTFQTAVMSVSGTMVPGQDDGYDLAFYTNVVDVDVDAPIPVPGALPLMLSVLGGGAFLRKKLAR